LKCLAQGNPFFQGGNGKGIRSHMIGKRNSCPNGAVAVSIGLDDDNYGTSLSIGGGFDLFVIVKQGGITNLVDGSIKCFWRWRSLCRVYWWFGDDNVLKWRAHGAHGFGFDRLDRIELACLTLT
jgi:hypothetical protein